MANYLAYISGKLSEVVALVSSTGAGDAGKIPALDSTGRLDTSVMPTGIGADVAVVTTSEALAAGAIVNLYNVSGVPTARNASAASVGKPAHGFVLASTTSGANANVYLSGRNTQVSGLTAGSNVYLSTTAGGVTTVCPTASGNNQQQIGVATSTTAFSFSPQLDVTKA